MHFCIIKPVLVRSIFHKSCDRLLVLICQIVYGKGMGEFSRGIWGYCIDPKRRRGKQEKKSPGQILSANEAIFYPPEVQINRFLKQILRKESRNFPHLLMQGPIFYIWKEAKIPWIFHYLRPKTTENSKSALATRQQQTDSFKKSRLYLLFAGQKNFLWLLVSRRFFWHQSRTSDTPSQLSRKRERNVYLGFLVSGTWRRTVPKRYFKQDRTQRVRERGKKCISCWHASSTRCCSLLPPLLLFPRLKRLPSSQRGWRT